MFTVAQLIQRLEGFDPNLPVALSIDPEGNGFRLIDRATKESVERSEWEGRAPPGLLRTKSQDVLVIWPN
jgi:hypothetical protein